MTLCVFFISIKRSCIDIDIILRINSINGYTKLFVALNCLSFNNKN